MRLLGAEILVSKQAGVPLLVKGVNYGRDPTRNARETNKSKFKWGLAVSARVLGMLAHKT